MRKDVKSLGQIFNGLGNLLDGLSSLAEHGSDLVQTVNTRTGRTASLSYGWSIGPVSASRGDDAGDADVPLTAAPRTRADAVQDVFDEGVFVRAVVEVPGVVDGDIHFHVNGQTLTIEARRRDGRRIIRLRIPAAVSTEGATSSYRNGMFEIVLPKATHGSR